MKASELLEIRTRLGLTHAEMARLLGFSADTAYARVERGERKVSGTVAELATLADELFAKGASVKALRSELLKRAKSNGSKR